jgi:hypothetical protein
MKEAGLPLDALVAYGRSMMHWRLDNQDGFADSPAMWGKQDIDVEY